MIRLTDGEFSYIARFVRTKYGIDLEKKKILIECRLQKELEKNGLDSFQKYFNMVEKDRTGKMANEMIHRLTTHYTYFYREEKHFEFVKNVILPEVERTWKGGCYQIWCAGCATGEEAYTLAMILKDYEARGGRLPQWMILATDISEEVLEQGRKGIYPKKELEKVPALMREKYFQPQNDGMLRASKELRAAIQFRSHNLMDTDKRAHQYDLIMCRNVMIYFDIEVRRELIRKLEGSLRTGGYLLVGHSELLTGGNTILKSAGLAAYKKE